MRITVAGSATETLPPDVANLTLRVVVESNTREGSVTRATEVSNALAAQLTSLAAERPDAVSATAVHPLTVSSWQPTDNMGQPLPTRHVAQCRARATISDFTLLSTLVDEWARREEVAVDEVTWDLDSEHRSYLTNALLAQAVSQATTRARTLALAAGAKEVTVVELADEGLLGGSDHLEASDGMQRAMFASAKSSGVEIDPSPIEVTCRIHARFEAR